MYNARCTLDPQKMREKTIKTNKQLNQKGTNT